MTADRADRPWRATVVTILPDMFPGPLGQSLSGKGLDTGLWTLETVDIRDFARDKHRSVDDTPAGGGPGMVLRADIVDAALEAATAGTDDRPLIYLSPRGAPLTQERVRRLSDGPGAVLLCGRFEGVDERVLEARRAEEISLGDFVLSGGEIAAMAVIDAAVRLLPGVMGKIASGEDESFEGGLLEYPHYTRPRVWQGREIPEVLTSGDHGRIARWRRQKAEETTRLRRPDLWRRHGAPGGGDGEED